MKKLFQAILLLLVAGSQTAVAQGFRVYKSDGTVLQFSLHTDSIVFYDGIGSDVDFGPFTPVNECIVGTWYKNAVESYTFNEDGTTNYISGGTYEFRPYVGSIVIYNASGAPVNILSVRKLTAEQMIVTPEGGSFSVWYSAPPVVAHPVETITLNETSLHLKSGESVTLYATVLPSDAENKEVQWKSSNESVAAVTQNGRVMAGAGGTSIVTCSATDGSGVKAECVVSVQAETEGITGGHAWVDLGLPSGTLWATMNVGATKPEEYGNYYAWGETTIFGKTDYSWATYKWCEGSENTITKYCTESSYGYNGFTDGLTELLPGDDAASVNWGESWQMPSIEQLVELINSLYTTTEWTQENGVNGIKITSMSNGNSIFLPAPGYRCGTSLHEAGSSGVYWSRSLLSGYTSLSAYMLSFNSRFFRTDASFYRYYGQSVRPVRVQN